MNMNIDSPDGNYIYTNLGMHFTATRKILYIQDKKKTDHDIKEI